MKELDSIPVLPITAEEAAASYILNKNTNMTKLVLHMPSAEDLLQSVLLSPELYLTPLGSNAEGIRVYKLPDGYTVKDQIIGFSDSRKFNDVETCYAYLIPLFRRYLSNRFEQFGYLDIWVNKFPTNWRYSKALVLKLFSQSLVDDLPPPYTPLRPRPTVVEVADLLVDKEDQFLSDSTGDGIHIRRTPDGYIKTSYDRGMKYREQKFATFRGALEDSLSSELSSSPADSWRFSGLNSLEFSWRGPEPPV